MLCHQIRAQWFHFFLDYPEVRCSYSLEIHTQQNLSAAVASNQPEEGQMTFLIAINLVLLALLAGHELFQRASDLFLEWMRVRALRQSHPEMEGVTEEEELLGFQIDEALGAVILNNEEPGKDEPFLLDPAFFEDDGE